MAPEHATVAIIHVYRAHSPEPHKPHSLSLTSHRRILIRGTMFMCGTRKSLT